MNRHVPQKPAGRLSLKSVGGDEALDVLPVFVQATAPTPLGSWLYPRRSMREARLPVAFTELIRQATSVVLAVWGGMPVGGVLWRQCRTGQENHPFAALAATGHPDNARLAALASRVTVDHPQEPHDDVLGLAVLPNFQHRHIGRALLATASPATSRYLIIPAGRWRGLLGQGYLPYGARIDLPHSGPPLQPMRCAAPDRPPIPAPGRRRAPRRDPPARVAPAAPG